MSDLANQKINLSYSGLLQIPGGLTASLQAITDGNGTASALQMSTTGISGQIISDTVTITGGTINGTTIGAVNPAAGRFSTLTAGTLTGLLKGSTGVVSAATANTDYLTPPAGTAIQKANSGGALQNATSGVDYAPATSGTSILKANGSGGFTNAASGTDYAPATSGTSILYGNGSGGFSNVTVGSGLQFSGGTLISTSGGGSVTTVSVVSANGFAGSVANASSTPAITLSTSVTGLLKGNGTAISAATAGTDYAPATSGTSILKGDNAGGFSAAVAGTDYAGLASANTFTNDQVISVNSSSDALRITQTGAGNALMVEDSANPDTSPFVINSAGYVYQGSLSSLAPSSLSGANMQVNALGSTQGALALAQWSAVGSASAQITLSHSNSGTVGTQTAVTNGAALGKIRSFGSDGSNFIEAASIEAFVDGTPGTNDMPGRLVFSTTKDGASSPTEAMRITNDGRLVAGLGAGAGSSATQFTLGGTLVSAASTTRAFSNIGTAPTTSTSSVVSYFSQPTTADGIAATNIFHFLSSQGTITGGTRTAPTAQYGFYTDSTLTGATNNYGFYSNIASGTGRYNFYAGGTAANYFAGDVTIDGNTTVKNYTETSYSANSSTAITLNLANGTQQYITLTGSPTITMPTAAAGKSFTLILYTGSGGYTVSWSTVAWASGSTPTVTTTASKKDIFNFYSDGTNWYGSIFGQSF